MAEFVMKSLVQEAGLGDNFLIESAATSAEEIGLQDTDGNGKEYVFYYNNIEFHARYTPDNWKIIDSFRVTEPEDMVFICQALSDVNPVPSRDWQSYRTADDMAYEWDQHNKIYLVAPKDSYTRERTRNVDLDPEDQGKTYEDLYRENLG